MNRPDADPYRGPPAEELVPVGTPIDLDNCAREPIHIPGSIQPRGVLAIVREPDGVVVQISTTVVELLGVELEDALECPLAAVIGERAAGEIERAMSSFTDLRERNPLEITIDVFGRPTIFDAILHREPGGYVLVELENGLGPRPFSFPNTYRSVRSAVGALNRAASLDELYTVAADAVRSLTGFDRVMVYRYDADYNGEVVAEARHANLNPFLGLHYPATDIPAQARALYEKNWIRLISDVDYTPAPVVPAVNPITGRSLDLTYSTLRSVSPIHIEYLQNMGVRASMSISLLRDGKLWGLIACHHYSGPHVPPYGTRAAAEFLGSALSLRLIDRFEDDELRGRLESQAVLAKLAAATLDESESIGAALFGAPDLLDLVRADGVALLVQGRYDFRGTVPDQEVVDAIAAWAREGQDPVTATDALSKNLPALGIAPELASGALVLSMPEGQYAIWFRVEALRSVDWGGDPGNKAIAVREGDSVRLSPRRSFERWREVVQQRSLPWTVDECDAAEQLRRLVIEAMYQRSRGEARLAEKLQRSLLPEIPVIPGWGLSAHYEPAAGGRIGGDWYDAFTLRDGRLAVVLGDVAGHGIGAAGTMTQLRNALRAYLFEGLSPVGALGRLNEFTTTLLPGAFATVVVACVDLATGHVEATTAGHPVPFIVDPATGPARAELAISPPLGVRNVTYLGSEFELAPGALLVLFSDGLVERRDEDIDDGIDRLAVALSHGGDLDARHIWDSVASRGFADDATVVSLHRPA